ncbi:hypothetical protein VIBHAR_05828 [Vibrio campbellii ATCC BAA-1116]|uniref:Uncharacterized protein n=1 Tax=Vibrio campbellii (strain ATCC BAA-1116) TaxID=2902295 RepID=A7N2B9_VIBC1|nr:hypothetical protein VIBHAR_04727 [Vibrio campbellii ATCC BAA-1116]ABU73722.1 hypothetical protein VIBHAR_05828 [Vibrio campbellii ATCC BAA-1116]
MTLARTNSARALSPIVYSLTTLLKAVNIYIHGNGLTVFKLVLKPFPPTYHLPLN